MKRLFLFLLALMGLTTPIKADVEFNEINFPDSTFRANLLTYNYAYCYDGVLTDAELADIKEISLWKESAITDLTGIEYFTALEWLNCGYTSITSLDLSHNMALKTLVLEDSKIVSLDVSNHTALTFLNVQSTHDLTSLDVTNCTSLKTIWVSYGKATSLDVSSCTSLKSLECHHNYDMTSLNVTGCTALEELVCYADSLFTLDVSQNPALTTLNCYNNELTSLDVSNNPALTKLNCERNYLTSLNVSNNPALTKLECYENELTSLNLTSCPALTTLECYNNKLTSILFHPDATPTTIKCFGNKFGLEDMRQLVFSMPEVSDGLFCVYDNRDNATDENVISRALVDYIKGKGWAVRCMIGYNSMMDYEGVDVSYNLWLRGHQLTSTNCNNLTALAGVSGTVASFNELTNTLTLGDVTIISSGITPKPGIESNIDGLTINVVGTNNINMTDTTAIVLRKNATIKGPGTLTAQSSSSNGIYIYGGTLSVTGGATLNAVANSAPATTKTGFGIYGRTVARLDPRGGGTIINYYGSLDIDGYNTKVQSIGSMASVAMLNALTYPTGSTLKVVDPSTSREVNGYFNNHNVCTRSGNAVSGYTFTPTTALVRISAPTIQQGDVNEDGTVDVSDVAALADMLVGNTPFSDTADVDGNGTVSLADLTTLVNKVKN